LLFISLIFSILKTKTTQMLKDKVTEIFVDLDDFHLKFEEIVKNHRISSSKANTRNRKGQLSESEIMSILILFHYGQFKNFKHFYIHYVVPHLCDLFPNLVSYNRFIQLQKRIIMPLMLYIN